MTVARAITHAPAALLLAALLATPGSSAPTQRICRNEMGTHDGVFFTFWKDQGEACMTLFDKGRYAVTYSLGGSGNLVVGKGWETGSASRVIGYNASRFDAGTNSYLGLYGWTTKPLIEYYVVDSWGSEFTPPGEGVKPLAEVVSDGGTYRIYRTQRVNKPSILGTRTFYQYWSVRTKRRPLGSNLRITFADHVAAWKRLGFTLGKMDYQILATEGFGSKGGSDLTVWEDRPGA